MGLGLQVEGRAPAHITPQNAPMSVVVIRELDALGAYLPAWEELAATSVEPNVFYEPWMLLPALKSFASGKDIRLVLILAGSPELPLTERTLTAIFPLEYHCGFKRFPLTVLSLWKYIHCYLCTPLLKSGYAHQSLATFLNWFTSHSGTVPLMALRTISAEGLFSSVLLHQLKQMGLGFVSTTYTRPLLLPGNNCDEYLGHALSGKRRRTLTRKEKRLSEEGRVEYLVQERDVRTWIERFLKLEASGWKGRAGTALAANEADRTFFEAIVTEAYRRGRLLTHSLLVDGRPIAQRCSFLAGRGAFSFKTAYDETYAPFSPGVLLEVDNMRYVHARDGIQWMDSCASSDEHSSINDLWADRKTLQTLLVTSNALPEKTLISLVPLSFLRGIRPKLRQWIQRPKLRPVEANP